MIQIILLLSSGYFFHHGLYPLITGKPAIKADAIRKTVMVLIIVEIIYLLGVLFLGFVAWYGYSYRGMTIGNEPFYIILLLLTLLIFWLLYCWENDSDTFKYSESLISIRSDYALDAARETLSQMEIKYRESITGFELPDKGFTMAVTISGRQIRFSVSKAIDKIFLYQFSKVYQALYKQKYPLKRKFAFLSALLGGIMLIFFILTTFDILIVNKIISCKISDLSRGILH